MVSYAKFSPKMMNLRDKAGNAEEEEEDMCLYLCVYRTNAEEEEDMCLCLCVYRMNEEDM